MFICVGIHNDFYKNLYDILDTDDMVVETIDDSEFERIYYNFPIVGRGLEFAYGSSKIWYGESYFRISNSHINNILGCSIWANTETKNVTPFQQFILDTVKENRYGCFDILVKLTNSHTKSDTYKVLDYKDSLYFYDDYTCLYIYKSDLEKLDILKLVKRRMLHNNPNYDFISNTLVLSGSLDDMTLSNDINYSLDTFRMSVLTINNDIKLNVDTKSAMINLDKLVYNSDNSENLVLLLNHINSFHTVTVVECNTEVFIKALRYLRQDSWSENLRFKFTNLHGAYPRALGYVFDEKKRAKLGVDSKLIQIDDTIYSKFKFIKGFKQLFPSDLCAHYHLDYECFDYLTTLIGRDLGRELIKNLDYNVDITLDTVHKYSIIDKNYLSEYRTNVYNALYNKFKPIIQYLNSILPNGNIEYELNLESLDITKFMQEYFLNISNYMNDWIHIKNADIDNIKSCMPLILKYESKLKQYRFSAINIMPDNIIYLRIGSEYISASEAYYFNKMLNSDVEKMRLVIL